MACVDTRVELSDGAKLRVRLLGSEDTRKPVLIALHGAPGASSHVETEAAYTFLEGRFRVLVYDARGSGVSDLKGPFTDERWIADVDELRWVNCQDMCHRRLFADRRVERGLVPKLLSSRVVLTAAS